MDILYINGLKVETIIGLHDWERETRQTVVLDLELATFADKAAVSDWIGYAVDYSKVATRVVAFVENSKYRLIETLAEQVARIIMREFSVVWIHLRVSKPGAIPGTEDVGIIIERGVQP